MKSRKRSPSLGFTTINLLSYGRGPTPGTPAWIKKWREKVRANPRLAIKNKQATSLAHRNKGDQRSKITLPELSILKEKRPT